jgi:hypothetical protein
MTSSHDDTPPGNLRCTGREDACHILRRAAR